MNQYALGKELSVLGKDHLQYLMWLQKGDYEVTVDVPDDASKKDIDKAFDEAAVKEGFRLLEEHKATCSNCTLPYMEKIKDWLRSKGWKG